MGKEQEIRMELDHLAQVWEDRQEAVVDLVKRRDTLDRRIAKIVSAYDRDIKDCEAEIEELVLDFKKSVKTPSATATYTCPSVRRSCKYDALEGYGNAHPEVLEFITYRDVAARVSIKVH